MSFFGRHRDGGGGGGYSGASSVSPRLARWLVAAMVVSACTVVPAGWLLYQWLIRDTEGDTT